jgi:hypothetical protein
MGRYVNKTIRMLAAALLVISAGQGLRAESIFVYDEHLNIRISNKAMKADTKVKLSGKKWLKICQNIGESMLVKKSAYETGMFKSFNCILGDDMSKNPLKSPWLFEIDVKGEHIELVFTHEFEKNRRVTIGRVIKVKIRRSLIVGLVIGDKKFVDLLAYYYADSLPAAYRFNSYNNVATRGALVINTNDKIDYSTLPPPPKQLTLFQLWYDVEDAFWRPVVVGSATLVANPEKALKGAKKPPLRYLPKYRVDKINPELMIWGHISAGSGKAEKVLHKALGQRIRAIESENLNILEKATYAVVDTVEGSVHGGYIGFRYGYPLDQRAPLVSKTQIYSLLVELRSGPLEGLRLYYDFVPTVRDEAAGLKYKYGWNRTVLGWSLGTKVIPFIDRFDVVPKLGVWNFDAELPLDPNDSLSNYPVKIDYGPAFGLEAGAEWYGKWAQMRLWGATDLNIGFLSAGNESVRTLRGGADVLFDGPKLGSVFKLTYLASLSGEQVQIDIAEDKESGIVPSSLKFSQSFLGLGLSLSW